MRGFLDKLWVGFVYFIAVILFLLFVAGMIYLDKVRFVWHCNG